MSSQPGRTPGRPQPAWGLPGIALTLALPLGFLASPALPAWGRSYHVDLQLAGTCLGSYNPTLRSCSGGSGDAYSSLAPALAAAQAGDEVVLRGGTYGRIIPSRSGAAGNVITIRGYPGEQARVANLAETVALSIIGLSDIVIENIQVDHVLGFGRLEDSTRITIRDVVFRNATATGTTGALKFVHSSRNRVVGCTFENGSDNVLLQDESNGNVFENNVFTTGRHSLLSVRCSSFNVFRGNTFANPGQKAVEIYDCEGTSDAPVRLDATKHNLFEGNQFTQTAPSDRDYRYNAIQHGAQWTIVRRNVFRGCRGGGVNYQYYADESLYVYGNRTYNNTFYANACYALVGNSGPKATYYDNRATNNLFYRNTDCSGAGTQVRVDDPGLVILSGNALAKPSSDPLFQGEQAFDFHLAPSSPYVDKGVFLTTVVSGAGTALVVADASSFFDGYGIDGEAGDLIQLQGQTARARVVAINYATNTLTLDTPLAATPGLGVHVAFAGSSPDPGAFEGPE
jgi:hypothetical protein